jgi:hypothetical protein
MTPHREARIAHDQKIGKIENELAVNAGKIETETATEAKLTKTFLDLGAKAAADDRGALKKQRELATDLESSQIQIRNLAKRGDEIRKTLAELRRQRPTFVAAEIAENLKSELLVYPAALAEVSAMVSPVAEKFRALQKRLDQSVTLAISIIGAGNPDRTKPLGEKFRTLMSRALRAHLSSEFLAVGFDLGIPKSEGGFKQIFEPFVESLIAALSINLLPNSDDVRAFKCATNIFGLLGLDFRVGEIASLPVTDPAVMRLIASGALVQQSSGVAS